jgi:hypothetical protein
MKIVFENSMNEFHLRSSFHILIFLSFHWNQSNTEPWVLKLSFVFDLSHSFMLETNYHHFYTKLAPIFQV